MGFKKMLIILIAISVIMSVYVDVTRINVENNYNTVETVADLYNFEKLAANNENSIKDTLNMFKSNGLTGVAVPEVSLERLQEIGDIFLDKMSDVENIYNLSNNAGNAAITEYLKGLSDSEKRIQKDYIVVSTNNEKTYRFLKESLVRRVPSDKLKTLEKSGSYAFVINENMDTFTKQGLGFNKDDLDMVKSLGLDLIPRIENFNGIKDSDINNYVNLLKQYNVKTVIFGGNDVLGNPEKISYAASKFKKNGITIGIIDTPMGKKLQAGTEKFTKFDGYRGAKIYGLSEAETDKYDLNGIVDRWYRSIIERDVRIIYMRAKVDTTKTAAFNMNQNITMLKRINTLSEYAGLKLGIVKPMSQIHQTKLIEILISLGVIAGGILLLMLFGLKRTPSMILTIIGIVFTSLVLLSRFNDLGVKTIALASSIIYPSLAIGYFIDGSNKIIENDGNNHFIRKSIVIFIKTVLISLIGGLIIAAIMADSKYMLKLDYFRGVKLSFTIPVLVYIAYYCYKVWNINNLKKLLNASIKILNTNIKIWHIIAVMIAGVIGIIYISRTGNSPIVKPSGVELKFRSLLEHYLVARPRTKEFLVGYPALVLAVYAAFKKSKVWNFILGIFASIGILSMPNTMSHVESVLTIALERTIISWVFGVIIGIIVTIIINYLINLINKKRALL
ncbi:DUF5693 family protein [Thermoanaerobacterium sp. RBIITD]|uniref:DUF5693 family protein n=1 Tax=Thermoanaerobacterium sp. RBIITD TaxID=1550240 RepID=UPI000BB96252|nr:DUF5693 family protein [Thermoanaerobacterium sp. RBIITD]SNX54518.1 hypothetical protein SAMN05660242_2216 [Thermoanaerobacterium sp. RBIITD]